jgi:hypothetical protein
MKSGTRIAAALAVLSIALFGAGCAAKPHKAKVVAVYQEDVDANDGQVQKAWRTTLHLDNDGRVILPGKYGETGDTFTAYFTPGEGWGSNP